MQYRRLGQTALRRFHLDYLDFYLCHRPAPDMSFEEIAWSMHLLTLQGKILYWGTSEWPAQDIEALITFCRRHSLIPPQVEQPQYNLFHRQRVEQEYSPLAAQYGLGLTVWSPLASGVLAGRYDDGIPAGSRLKTAGFGWLEAFVFGENGGKRQAMLDGSRRLQSVADSLGISRAQLAIAWCLSNADVTSIILGASNTRQLSHNLDAIEACSLLNEDICNEIRAVIEIERMETA